MVSVSQLSALFFIMESDAYIPEPCFLARFLGSMAAEFLLLPNVPTCDPLGLFKSILQKMS